MLKRDDGDRKKRFEVENTNESDVRVNACAYAED